MVISDEIHDVSSKVSKQNDIQIDKPIKNT